MFELSFFFIWITVKKEKSSSPSNFTCWVPLPGEINISLSSIGVKSRLELKVLSHLSIFAHARTGNGHQRTVFSLSKRSNRPKVIV